MFGLAFIISLTTLVISVPIFLVFGLGSSLAAIAGLNLPWSVLIQVSFGALTKHVLIAVPLFIFTGMAMLKGGAASRLVKFTTTLVGHWPGGLGVAMVIAMGFFAAFCGSILAAITAVGTIMMPKMIEQGYPTPFVVVLAASAALLEALIPPSNAAILFIYLKNNNLFYFQNNFILNFFKIIFASILMGLFFNFLLNFFENQLSFYYSFKSIYLILSVLFALFFYIFICYFIKAFKISDIKLNY